MRSDNDVHRSVFYYMALAEKHGKLRYVTRKESMHVEIQKERHYRRLEKFRPMFFCMNDSEYAKDKDRKTAKEFLQSGNFLWNSGMFAWSVSTILSEMKNRAPELAHLLEHIASAWGQPGFSDVLCREYDNAPKISIDYAVMEKAAEIFVIPASFDWDDIGNWTALRNHIEPRGENNIIQGNAELLGCRDCIVHTEGEHLISGIDLEHLVIIQTGDATLICKDTSTPKIKDLLKKISLEKKFLKHL